MRGVGDDDVDRPGVDAQQCVELTGTNPSMYSKIIPRRRDDPRVCNPDRATQAKRMRL